MCESQWSTLLTLKPRRRRLRLLSETRCSALHIQGRDPRTPSGGEGRVQRREPPPQTPGAQHLGRRAIFPRAAVPHTGSVETANAAQCSRLVTGPEQPSGQQLQPSAVPPVGRCLGTLEDRRLPPLHPSQARFLGLGFLGTVEKPAPKRWSQVYNFTVFFGYSSSVSITKSQIYLCPIF